jgi:hypothetical protein
MQPCKRKLIHIAGVVTVMLTLSLPAARLDGGGRRRAVAVSPPSSSELTLTFLDGPVLDAGPIVWRGGKRRTTITTRTVAMRIGRASREARGTATLRAFLETPDPRAIVRIDGITLGAAPRVIERHAPIGIATTHRIEIEVPVSAPDGALAASIGWEVTTD